MQTSNLSSCIRANEIRHSLRNQQKKCLKVDGPCQQALRSEQASLDRVNLLHFSELVPHQSEKRPHFDASHSSRRKAMQERRVPAHPLREEAYFHRFQE